MGSKIKSLVSLIFSISSLVSCSYLSPAGFWNSFKKELILQEQSNQGPWGGTREIYWKSNTNNPFQENEILEFASKHKWKLVDSLTITEDLPKEKLFAELKIHEYSMEVLVQKVLAKEKVQNAKIYIFKTSQMLVNLNDGDNTFENGFILLNSTKTELKLVHLWGE